MKWMLSVTVILTTDVQNKKTVVLNARIRKAGFAIKQKIGVYFILVTVEGQTLRSIELRIVLKSINNYIVKIAIQREPINFRSSVRRLFREIMLRVNKLILRY